MFACSCAVPMDPIPVSNITAERTAENDLLVVTWEEFVSKDGTTPLLEGYEVEYRVAGGSGQRANVSGMEERQLVVDVMEADSYEVRVHVCVCVISVI